MTYRLSKNDLVLIRNKHQRCLQSVTSIPWEFQQTLIVVDIDKMNIEKVARKMHIEGRKISFF